MEESVDKHALNSRDYDTIKTIVVQQWYSLHKDPVICLFTVAFIIAALFELLPMVVHLIALPIAYIFIIQFVVVARHISNAILGSKEGETPLIQTFQPLEEVLIHFFKEPVNTK